MKSISFSTKPHNKRSLIVCTWLLFIISTVNFSCKKNDQLDQDARLVSQDLLIEKAHSYFQDHFDDPSKNKKKANHPSAQALWSKAYTKLFSIGPVVIVPLNWGENSFIKSKFSGEEKLSANENSYLLMYKDEGNLFHTEIVYSIADSTNKRDSSNFSGLVAVTDWNGNTLKLFRFKNGEEVPWKSDHQTSAREAVICYDVDWYYCTTEFGCRHSYTQTICGFGDDGSGTGSIYYGPSSGDYSSGGHSGSGGLSNNENIVPPELQPSNQILDITTVNDATGDRRIRSYKWVFLKNATLTFTSYDNSTQKKGSDGLWRFETLTHTDDSMTGFAVGWNISYALKGITPTVGQFWASMNFDCEVTSRATIMGRPIVEIRAYPCGRVFGIDEGK